MPPNDQIAAFLLIVIIALSASLCADDLSERLAARRARKQQAEAIDDDPLP